MGILGAAGRQTSNPTRIDLLRQNRPRNTVHRKLCLLIWRRLEPLNCVGDLRITRLASAELNDTLGAAECQTSYPAKIDILRHNRPRNTVHRKLCLMIWRRVELLNRVGDLRITR
jgi:hypothetical protein